MFLSLARTNFASMKRTSGAGVVAVAAVLSLATSQLSEAVSVRFYKDANLQGDSDSFDAGSLPAKGTCGDCKNLVRIAVTQDIRLQKIL